MKAPLLNDNEKHLSNEFSATGGTAIYRPYNDGSGDCHVKIICDTLKKWVCVQGIEKNNTFGSLFLCKRNRLIGHKKTGIKNESI